MPESASIESPVTSSTVPLEFCVTDSVRKLAGARFQRVALVSHPRHLAGLVVTDPDLLVVSTDWLTWRIWLKHGGKAVHYEGFLEEWPSDAGPPEEVFIRHSTWMYEDGRDLTLFDGVSLGKLFATHAGFAVRACYRLTAALDRLLTMVRPSALIFYDTYVEFDVLSPDARAAIVRKAATRNDVHLELRQDPVNSQDSELPEAAYSATEPEAEGLRAGLRDAYAAAIDAVTRLRSQLPYSKSGVFIDLKWNSVSALLRAYEAEGNDWIQPVLLAAEYPKDTAFLAKCLRSGVRLARLGRVSLTTGERNAIDGIADEVCKSLERRGEDWALVLAGMWRSIHEAGELYQNARLIKAYRALFRRQRIGRVVIGDMSNGRARLLAEMAWSEKIPCDEILNGVFVNRLPWDARCGDSFRPPILSRVLEWGQQTADWSRANDIKLPGVRTGYPMVDALLSQRLPRPGPRRQALVLPLSTEHTDVKALRANVFSYLVAVVKALEEDGFTVRVKLHPGRPNTEYYRAVLAHFSLAASVHKEGSLMEHLDWADFVVGPINSGAFIDAVAVGKPYYPVRPRPSSIRSDLCGPILLHENVAALRAAIRKGEDAGFQGALAYFCDQSPGRPAAPRVWTALSEGRGRD